MPRLVRWRSLRYIVVVSTILVLLMMTRKTDVMDIHKAQLLKDHPDTTHGPLVVSQKVNLQNQSTQIAQLNDHPVTTHDPVMASQNATYAQSQGFKSLPHPNTTPSCYIQAQIQRSLRNLEKMTRGNWHWQWIMERIKSLWPQWIKAAEALEAKHHGEFTSRKLKKILVIPGVLTETGYARPDRIKAGGPLGDLVQWADLIGALHVLGHYVHLQHDLKTACTHLLHNDFRGGPPECDKIPFHAIFTDILGHKKISPDIQRTHRCQFRIVDAYGTHAMFNNPKYAEAHNNTSKYGKRDLKLKQFYTYYPHTPDNSFLGFVARPPEKKQIKKPLALLYGKSPKYWTNRVAFVRAVMNMNITVHATIPKRLGRFLPAGVVFHGIVDSESYQHILSQSKFLLAAGAPKESSGVIEALGHGVVIIQPKFKGAERDILKGKPTARKLTSQVPYLEEFIGPPYVYTIDVTNPVAIRNTISTAMTTVVEPFVPEEFTMIGFLERLHHYIEFQNFCNESAPLWPPLEALWIREGMPGESCTEACSKKMSSNNKTSVCEPVYFKHINAEQYVSENIKRKDFFMSSKSDIYYPAIYDKVKQIVLQDNEALFSCEGSAEHLRRICPCRYAMKNQVALCERYLQNKGR